MTDDTQPLLRDILGEVRDGFASIRDEIAALRVEVRDGFARIDKELELTNRQLEKLGYQFGRTVARVDLLEERIDKLEHRAE